MKYRLTQEEVWDRLRKRPYVISYLQHNKILFKAIQVLRKHPTDNFYYDRIPKIHYVDELFRSTWSFDSAPHLKGWKLMNDWEEYYKSKCEL